MKVLVACEFSGVVRDAFTARGHDAMSVDLLPTESEGWHYQGDVLDVLGDGWDLMVAHPPCTFLSNSGVRWLHTEEGRWEQLDRAAHFFRQLLEAPIPKLAVENPVMHKYGKELIGRGQDQIVHPYWFGHLESKATCLWLEGLDPLVATHWVKEEMEALPKNQSHRVHHAAPSPDRWKLRSVTYQGLADAMAEQWG